MAEVYNKIWQEKHDRFMKRTKSKFSISRWIAVINFSFIYFFKLLYYSIMLISV